ncbi:MAG: flagellar M-ring protein FliF [Pseudomonadota bacterium]|nr:flagellar M-ring protein FliF [Pseudomonadota bacterium]
MSTLTDSMRGMGKAKIGAMAAVGLVVFGFFMVMALRMSAGGMAPLYTGLSLEDSSKIVAELEKTGTPYELVGNGSEIMVPDDRVLRLRMNMAEEGLPSGGNIVGYEIFDRSETFGSSSLVMNINMVRALEGELSRTIESLNNVDSARVHLVMGNRQLFTRDREKPSASVTIKMRGGKTLEHGEVVAVSHLVASAVPGLEASKVTIVDSYGRLLARGDGAEGLDAGADTAQEYRVAYENHLEQTLEDMIEKVVGPGKVRVQVAADINLDRVVTNSEKYDPDGQVARSTQSNSETDNAQDKSGKDTTTVANNLPGGNAGGEGAASSDHKVERSTETTNYEISKTVQNHVTEGGTVNKLSVAVLVDGNYTTDADGKQTYAPRSDDEIKQIKTLVSSAMGYDDKRGDRLDVVNMRFTQEAAEAGGSSFFERFKMEIQPILQTLIIAVVAVLAILLVLRPAINQLIKQSQAPSDRVAGELAALESPGAGAAAPRLPGAPAGGGGQEPELLIDVANIKGGMKSSSMKKINEIVEKYPEETMGVLRQWVLKQS